MPCAGSVIRRSQSCQHGPECREERPQVTAGPPMCLASTSLGRPHRSDIADVCSAKSRRRGRIIRSFWWQIVFAWLSLRSQSQTILAFFFPVSEYFTTTPNLFRKPVFCPVLVRLQPWTRPCGRTRDPCNLGSTCSSRLSPQWLIGSSANLRETRHVLDGLCRSCCTLKRGKDSRGWNVFCNA